ncbi:MAG: hypothetical protein AAF628_13935 [Planctomycetota bacterium]
MSSPLFVSLGLTAFAVGGPLLGQDPSAGSGASGAAAVSFAPTTGAVQLVDGQLLGHGADYRVAFGDDQVEFTPALGRQVSRTSPWTFTLTTVDRDGAHLGRDRATRSHQDNIVRYGHGTFDEVYEVRADGLKQSFVFHRVPAGHGDLVVRGRVTTHMRGELVRDGLKFDADGIGHVQVDPVVGFDGDGRTVRGSIAWSATGEIEMRLPAPFVDRATLPLTLDPLISFFAVSSVQDEEDPDVASNPTTGRSLAVWTRYYASNDADIMGNFIGADGSLVGGTFFIRSTVGGLAFDPHVCFVEQNTSFVAIWNENLDVWAKGVESSSGALTPLAQVTNNTAVEFNLDIGGDISGVDNDAIAVWGNATQGVIEAVQIQVNPGGTLSPFIPAAISPTGAQWIDLDPAISKTDGGAGRHLIVWDRRFRGSAASEESDIRGWVVDRNLNLLEFVVIATGTDDDDNPDVDGDGANWVVAWERETDAGSGDNDVLCAALTYDGATSSYVIAAGEVVVEGDRNDDERKASVAWLGNSVLIGFVDEVSGSNDDAFVKSLDPFTCTLCEGEFNIEIGNPDTDTVAISAFMGGLFGTPPKAIVLWDPEDPSSPDRGIQGSVFDAADGRSTDFYGGPCLGGGTAFATCAVTGNASFTIRVQRAEPSTNAFLLISPFANEFWNRGCRIMPDLFTSVVVPNGPTNSMGDSRFLIPLPATSSLVGASFWTQWIVDTAADIGTSQALKVTIE